MSRATPRLLALALLLAAGAAWARVEPATPDPDLGRLLTGVVHIVTAMQTAIGKWFAGDALIQRLGKQIAVVLFALVTTWGLIKSMLLGKGFAGLAGDAVLPLFMTALVFAACDAGLGLKIYRSMVTLALMLPTGEARPTLIDPGALGLQVIEVFGRAGLTVWKMDFGSGISISRLIGGIGKIIAGIGLMACGALGCATIMLAQMAGALGALLAPVLIPWGIWAPTSFLFTGWLRYMITSGLQIVVTYAIGAMVAGIASRFIEPGAISAPSSPTEALGMAGGLLLFAMISLMFMMKAAELASGLVSGDGSLSSDGWQSAGRLTGVTVAGKGLKLAAQKTLGPVIKEAGSLGLALAGRTAAGRKVKQVAANVKERYQRFKHGAPPPPPPPPKPPHQPLTRRSVQARQREGGR